MTRRGDRSAEKEAFWKLAVDEWRAVLTENAVWQRLSGKGRRNDGYSTVASARTDVDFGVDLIDRQAATGAPQGALAVSVVLSLPKTPSGTDWPEKYGYSIAAELAENGGLHVCFCLDLTCG